MALNLRVRIGRLERALGSEASGTVGADLTALVKELHAIGRWLSERGLTPDAALDAGIWPDWVKWYSAENVERYCVENQLRREADERRQAEYLAGVKPNTPEFGPAWT